MESHTRHFNDTMPFTLAYLDGEIDQEEYMRAVSKVVGTEPPNELGLALEKASGIVLFYTLYVIVYCVWGGREMIRKACGRNVSKEIS